MLMHRRTLRRFAVWLTLALLLAQWATATYACPGPAATAQLPAGMSSMPRCHDATPGAPMDAERPLLCKAHCDAGSQTVNDTHAQVPERPAPPVWAVLDWNLRSSDSVGAPLPFADRPAAWQPPPALPVYLVLRVLRN